MAKYAKGKKSLAISDISGLRVPYTQLKTTWDGLRVSPEDFDPKQPQLTPAKNVVDATALRNPRPDTDPENVVVFIGYTQDWTIEPILRPGVGVNGPASVGNVFIDIEAGASVTGVGGTANVGTAQATIQTEIIARGQAGTGGVSPSSASYLQYAITVSNPGSGNRYYVDSVLQQQLYLQEGTTARFDQSHSSNNGHPLRLSTTSNGTHAGGSAYTTGVTVVGTPGQAGAYTEITVAATAPTLYYYCSNHSLMGGTSYTPSSGTVSLAITVSNPGAGNRYYIDSGGPAPTVSLIEGTTYKFDQSNSSNSGHPLRFSTTSNGTHGGGSEYTTGVTTSGTPGQAGAYTQITVADGAPTLYYYCTQHSQMGGQLNTPTITILNSTVLVELDKFLSGVGGSGDPGTVIVDALPPITGVSGTGGVGTEAFLLEATPAGVGGAANVGSVDINNLLSVSGVGGSGNIGIAGIEDPLGWGIGPWGLGPFGDDAGRPPAIGQAGTGGVSTPVIATFFSWGSGGWGQGAWNADVQPFPTSVNGTGGVGTVSILIATTWGADGWSEGQWN